MAIMRAKNDEWMSLPDEHQLHRLIFQGQLHPAMKMAAKAIHIKRSPNQAFILLVGSSGAGKSLTVNYMLQTNVAKTSTIKSETRCTTEYTVHLKSNEWKIPDLKLSIIDTPGFNDTDGLKQDAKNIMSIRYFLKSHPKIGKSYPNLVLIALNIQDNRIEGEHSSFAKMLKGISEVNAIDCCNPNVVVVLTHAGSIPRKLEVWKQTVEKKKEHVIAIVHHHLGIKPEIVVQENQPEDNELKRDGDYYLLPNGEKQPKILYQACNRILNTSNDYLGLEAVALGFRPDMDKSVSSGHVTYSSDVSTEDTQFMHKILLKSVVNVSSSEVYRLLETHKTKKKDIASENDILVLQLRLQELGISNTDDLLGMSMYNLLNKLYPTKISKEMKKVLGEVFGLSFDQSAECCCHVGRGYDIFKDSATQFSPLVMEESDECQYGFPANVNLQECNTFEIKCESIKDSNDYVRKRLRDLKIDNNGEINFRAFNIQPRSGYNISNGSRPFAIETETSFSVEHAIQKLVIRPPFRITNEFKTDVKALPTDYDLKDESRVMKWKAFFEKWGMYVITGSSLGGSLNGKVKVVQDQTLIKNFEDAHALLAMKISSLHRETSYDWSQKRTYINSTILSWSGGNKETYKQSLENIERKDWKAWVESLKHSPVPLWSDLDLYPLYHLASEVCPEKGTQMQMAMNLALNGRFAFEPPKEDNRINTATSRPSDGCFHEDSVVMLHNGKLKQMKELTIGDKIFSADSHGKLVQDEVIAWLHQVRGGQFTFLQIVHDFGKITLTPEHIIFVGKHRNPQLASTLRPGNKISCFTNENNRQAVTMAMVLSIHKVEGQGIYAPLTTSGRLLVDRIEVSCYCILKPLRVLGREMISSHSLAHAGFLPLRIAYKCGLNFFDNSLDDDNGLHGYARWLMKVILRFPGLNFVFELDERVVYKRLISDANIKNGRIRYEVEEHRGPIIPTRFAKYN